MYARNNPLIFIDPLGLYWEYAQSSGQLTYVANQTGARTLVGTGYSGNALGLNNTSMQNIAYVGPIPQGIYDIGQAYRHQHLGPLTMNLIPRPATNTFGRNLFRMHGDNSCQCESASEGCVILPRNIREQVNNSTDREMRVVK